MKNRKLKLFTKLIAILAGCLLIASFSPSLDGRAVVVDEGVFPEGLFAKTVGYLPGDVITVTSIGGETTVDLLVIGALDPSEGVAIMLSPEAAQAIGIEKKANSIVKITKRSSQDERVFGTAVIAKKANETDGYEDIQPDVPVEKKILSDGIVEIEYDETLPLEEDSTEEESDDTFEDDSNYSVVEVEEEKDIPSDEEFDSEENDIPEIEPEEDVVEETDEATDTLEEEFAVESEENFEEELENEVNAVYEEITETPVEEDTTDELEDYDFYENEMVYTPFEEELYNEDFGEPIECEEELVNEEDCYNKLYDIPSNEDYEEELVLEELPPLEEKTVEPEPEIIAEESEEIEEAAEPETIEETEEISEEAVEIEDIEESEIVPEEPVESEVEEELEIVPEEVIPDEIEDEPEIEPEEETDIDSVETEDEETEEEDDVIPEPESPAEETVETDETVESEEDEENDILTEEYEAIVLVPADENPPEMPEEEPESEITEIPEDDVISVEEPELILEAEILSEPQILPEEMEEPEVEPVVEPEPVVEDELEQYKVESLKNLKSGYYYIQIAVYKDSVNIEEIVKKYGENYPITLVPLASGAAYQVMIGPLNVDEYATVLTRFKAYGYKDAFLRKIK